MEEKIVWSCLKPSKDTHVCFKLETVMEDRSTQIILWCHERIQTFKCTPAL